MRNPPLPPDYYIWINMKQRCQNRNNPAYRNYGGRGIQVCERWMEFSNFAADLGRRPEGYTLERRNNNGHYEPGNCYWATRSTQSRNRRGNVVVLYAGQEWLQTDLAAHAGLTDACLSWRLRRGWSIETAVRTPSTGRIPAKQLEYKGTLWTVKALAEHTGVGLIVLKKRLRSGWSVEKAVDTLVVRRKSAT